jgi:TolA-binding protein
LFCLGSNSLFAADKNLDKYLQSRIEILEQKIKLLQQEQELTNAKLEECSKNVSNYQNSYQQSTDDIKFHRVDENQNGYEGKFSESKVKIEQDNIHVNNNYNNNEVHDSNTVHHQIELVMDHNALADMYNNAVEQIRLKNADESKSLLKKIVSVKIDENSDSDSKEIVANAHYLIGELSLKAKNYEQASSHFLSAYNFFSKNDNKNIQGANSLYQLAKSLHMMDKKDGACNSLKKIGVEFKKLPENLKNKIDIEVTNLHCK